MPLVGQRLIRLHDAVHKGIDVDFRHRKAEHPQLGPPIVEQLVDYMADAQCVVADNVELLKCHGVALGRQEVVDRQKHQSERCAQFVRHIDEKPHFHFIHFLTGLLELFTAFAAPYIAYHEQPSYCRNQAPQCDCPPCCPPRRKDSDFYRGLTVAENTVVVGGTESETVVAVGKFGIGHRPHSCRKCKPLSVEAVEHILESVLAVRQKVAYGEIDGEVRLPVIEGELLRFGDALFQQAAAVAGCYGSVEEPQAGDERGGRYQVFLQDAGVEDRGLYRNALFLRCFRRIDRARDKWISKSSFYRATDRCCSHGNRSEVGRAGASSRCLPGRILPYRPHLRPISVLCCREGGRWRGWGYRLLFWRCCRIFQRVILRRAW